MFQRGPEAAQIHRPGREGETKRAQAAWRSESPRVHLVHEAVGRQTQPDDVDAQHAVSRQGDVVLSEVVLRDGQTPTVLRPVDLDHEVEAVPPDIEVDAPTRRLSHHLSCGLRQPAGTTETGEVELAETLHAERNVSHDRPDERPTGASAHESLSSRETHRRREALLHRHEQDEGSLPVGRRPVRRSDRGDLRAGPRQAGLDELAGHPSDHLVDPDAREPLGVVVVHGRDVQAVVDVAREAGMLQGGDAVDGGDGRARLEERRPTPGQRRERSGVHRDRLPAVSAASDRRRPRSAPRDVRSPGPRAGTARRRRPGARPARSPAVVAVSAPPRQGHAPAEVQGGRTDELWTAPEPHPGVWTTPLRVDVKPRARGRAHTSTRGWRTDIESGITGWQCDNELCSSS